MSCAKCDKQWALHVCSSEYLHVVCLYQYYGWDGVWLIFLIRFNMAQTPPHSAAFPPLKCYDIPCQLG